MLAGCAASGPTGSEILTGSIAPTASRLVIYRVSAVGLAVQPDYIVDGHSISNSLPNGFVVCDLPAGRHQVEVGNLPIAIPLFASGSQKMEVNLRPGSTTYLHAQPQMGLTFGVVTLTEVTENQGRSDTATLHKIDAQCGLA